MQSRRTHWPLLGLLFSAIGCSSEQRHYELSVENQLAKPITFWLVKQHGPMEDGWLSPEQIATLAAPPEDDQLPAVVVPAGKTASTRGPVTGEFDKARGRAFMRVYSGTPTLTEMLAVGRGSANRLDVPLRPGRNRVVIHDRNGLMDAAITH